MNDSGLLGMGDDAWMDGVRDDSDGTPRVSGFGFGVTARGLGLFSERRVAPSRLAFRGGDNGARCVANGMIRTRVGSRSNRSGPHRDGWILILTYLERD